MIEELKVLAGVITWILLHLATSKDSNEKNFKFRLYFKRSWDNWLFALAGGFIVYYAFPFVWAAWFNWKGKDVPELVQFYAPVSGFFGGFVLQIAVKLLKKFTNGKP